MTEQDLMHEENFEETTVNSEFKQWLLTFLSEKGTSLDTEFEIDGHFGLTVGWMVDYMDGADSKIKNTIKNNIVKIDYNNGDHMHFLTYCAKGALQAEGYEI